MGRQTDPTARFWSYVDRSAGPDGCWIWTSGTCGYGYYKAPNGSLAHRFSYELVNGPILKGAILRHTCGVKRCVNPRHLYIDPTGLPQPERFWARADMSAGPDGCWFWRRGNQVFISKGFIPSPPAAAYYFANGTKVPKGMSVRPACGTAGCIHPGHLELVPTTVVRSESRRSKTPKPKATHCRKGHPYGTGYTKNHYCPTCARERNRKAHQARTERNGGQRLNVKPYGPEDVPEQARIAFFRRIDKNGPGGCWDWTGHRWNSGYGSLKVLEADGVKRNKFAHRISYVIHKGEIPAGMFILHDCDRRSCVNPDHLRAGTPQENSDDMARRGRLRNGHSSEHAFASSTSGTFEERYWQRVDRSGGPDSCWHWLGCFRDSGYGVYGKRSAHRIAVELTHGPIPKGMHVLHSCDNRKCCNPAHLRVGTHAENMAEKAERQRCRTGSSHAAPVRKSHLPSEVARREAAKAARDERRRMAKERAEERRMAVEERRRLREELGLPVRGGRKLTPDQVLEMRRLYVPGQLGSGHKALAKRFGVTPRTVRSVVLGESWSRLKDRRG